MEPPPPPLNENCNNTTYVIDRILNLYLHPSHTMKSVSKSF
jgi:hypothetical protein